MSARGFTLREGWRAWRRGGLAGTLAMLSLAVLAAFIALFGGARQSLEEAHGRLLTRFEIEAFVLPGREDRLAEIAERLAARDGVMAVDTITREEAAKRFAERHGDDLIALLEENPLPASVLVRYEPQAIQSERMVEEASAVAAEDDIEEVAWDGELLARFEAASSRLLWVAAGLGALVLLISVALTLQSVRIATRTGRQWARAVYLVGGTMGQIRRPLAVGGLFTGLSGGLLGAGAVAALQWWLARSPWIAPPDPAVYAIAVGLPVLVGVLGASRAWRREP